MLFMRYHGEYRSMQAGEPPPHPTTPPPPPPLPPPSLPSSPHNMIAPRPPRIGLYVHVAHQLCQKKVFFPQVQVCYLAPIFRPHIPLPHSIMAPRPFFTPPPPPPPLKFTTCIAIIMQHRDLTSLAL